MSDTQEYDKSSWCLGRGIETNTFEFRRIRDLRIPRLLCLHRALNRAFPIEPIGRLCLRVGAKGGCPCRSSINECVCRGSRSACS